MYCTAVRYPHLGAVHKVRHANFCQFWPPVTLCHTSREPPKYVTHFGPPSIFSRPGTKNPDKSPLYQFALNCSWGFCQGVFCLEGFVWDGFCSFPLLSEYIC